MTGQRLACPESQEATEEADRKAVLIEKPAYLAGFFADEKLPRELVSS
jgi:hypothetical protein